jgi:predicted dehydrogenase
MQGEWRARPQYSGGYLLDGGFGYLAELRDFTRAIRTGEPPLSSFEECLQDILLIDRALNSASQGRV